MTEKIEIKTDLRTISAVTHPTKTSLSDFIAQKEESANGTSETETTDEGTTDEEQTSDDAEITDDQGAEADGVLDDKESDDEGTVVKGTNDDEQVFEVKGKKVKVKDLINSYETREEISRRFDEVGKKEQKIKAQAEKNQQERAELDSINEKFEEMREQVLAGNPLAALQIAASLADAEGDTPKGTSDLIKQAIQIADNFYEMSEDEQKVFLEKEELAFKERRIAKREKKVRERDEAIELRSYFDKALDQNGVTEEEADKAYEDIQKIPKYAEELKELKPKERINKCVSWVLGNRLNKTIDEAISSVDEKLVTDKEFRLALLDVIDPRYTKEQIAAIVRDFKGDPKKDNSEKESSAALTKDVAPKKSTTPNKAPTGKPKAEEKVKPITNFKDIIAKYSN